MQTGDPPVRQCVRSGLCCKTGPCPFGEWDAARHQCRHLEVSERGDGYTVFACGIKSYIEQQPGAEFAPAFGAGCCMPLFNENRAAILRHRAARTRSEPKA